MDDQFYEDRQSLSDAFRLLSSLERLQDEASIAKANRLREKIATVVEGELDDMQARVRPTQAPSEGTPKSARNRRKNETR